MNVKYLYKKKVKILPLAMVDDICGINRCGLPSLVLNTEINAHIELKKLKFHTPDEQGRSKCHKLHIGKKSDCCPELKVHGTKIEEVSEDEYLGDVITADGRNTRNVQKRTSRGMGMISEILNLLDILCSGIHYIEIALLLRESMFLSSMLNNTEVWYDVKKSEVESLEAMDLILLRKLLRAPVSTPKEAFYLELGIIPIRVLMKSRRILYLYYLLQRSPSEMLSQFFWQQWSAPVKGDWTVTVRQDLADFDMSADPEYLKSFSKYSFKKVVKEKAKDYAFKDLMKNKSRHSKLSKLSYTELTKQSYFELPEINIDEICLFVC